VTKGDPFYIVKSFSDILVLQVLVVAFVDRSRVKVKS